MNCLYYMIGSLRDFMQVLLISKSRNNPVEKYDESRAS